MTRKKNGKPVLKITPRAAHGINNSYKKECDIWNRSGITQYHFQITVYHLRPV